MAWHRMLSRVTLSCLVTALAGFKKNPQGSDCSLSLPQAISLTPKDCIQNHKTLLSPRQPLFLNISMSSPMTPPSLKKMQQFELGRISPLCALHRLIWAPLSDLFSESQTTPSSIDFLNFFSKYLHEIRLPMNKIDS